MLQRVWPNARDDSPEYILDEDADEVLLALLGHDTTNHVHFPTRQYLAYVRQKRAEQEARKQARHARARDYARLSRGQIHEQQKAEYLADLDRSNRQEWVSMFMRAIGECVLDSQYRSLIPNLERDMAMIAEHQGLLPWRLDRNVFWDTFARLKSEIDAKS